MTSDDLQQSDRMDVYHTIKGEWSLGRKYSHIDVSVESRAHLGDNATVHNYGQDPSREATLQKEQYQGFMQSLWFERLDHRRHTIDQAHAETCRWVFDTEPYTGWRSSALRDLHHGFFWIKGNPGSGKSTMMKCTLEHLERQLPDCAIASFFFNARGETLERTIQGSTGLHFTKSLIRSRKSVV